MSHIPQRKEKDCLNCGATVQGRYCHVCGQENVVPKETFWHMVTHFFYDVTHFDSQFFESVKDLLIRPGFLSTQYIKGRRVSYLHPIRMYVFTSAIFFLLFFSVFKPEVSKGKLSRNDRIEKTALLEEAVKKDSNNAELRNLLDLIKDTTRELTMKNIIDLTSNTPLTNPERRDYVKRMQKRIEKEKDNPALLANLNKAKDTTRVFLASDNLEDSSSVFSFARKYKTTEDYDSVQEKLPATERDSWLKRRIIKKAIVINEKFRENPDEALDKFVETSLHRLPYMLFVSLPLFAFILKLVYIRRKQFFYADHGVFTIHLYIFSFLTLIAVFSLNKLDEVVHFKFMGLVIALLILGLFFYLYKAMRNFYKQRRAKTVIKFILVAGISLIMMMLLLIMFMFFSVYTF